jgi:hypothetical protein
VTCAICGAAPAVATLRRPSGDQPLCGFHADLVETFNYRMGFPFDQDLVTRHAVEDVA